MDGMIVKYDKEGNPIYATETELQHLELIRADARTRDDVFKKALIRTTLEVEADPLFFKYQAGEIDKQVWLDKRQEIKDRYK